MQPKTLYDKLWASHVVQERDDGSALSFIDLHVILEGTSRVASAGRGLAGSKPCRVDTIAATADHNVPTTEDERASGLESTAHPVSLIQVSTLDHNCDEYGSVEFKINDPRQG